MYCPLHPVCHAAPQAMDWLGIPHAPGSLTAAFQHFLIHTGGRGVLDTIETKLGLTPEQARPPGQLWPPLLHSLDGQLRAPCRCGYLAHAWCPARHAVDALRSQSHSRAWAEDCGNDLGPVCPAAGALPRHALPLRQHLRCIHLARGVPSR